MKDFGKNVRALRIEKGISREDFCGNEKELFVRQLARIENGESMPTLLKAKFIANKLRVTLGDLTDGESFALPKRYKELKYLILRTLTYKDESRLKTRESYFDEIYENYYDTLIEEEQIAIECMRTKSEIFLTDDVDLGIHLLQKYFEQIKHKEHYTI